MSNLLYYVLASCNDRVPSKIDGTRVLDLKRPRAMATVATYSNSADDLKPMCKGVALSV